MGVWEKVAYYCERVYGTYIDWDERCFDCPECGEPIYECDWSDEDFFLNGRPYPDAHFACPVCDYDFMEGEDE